MVVFYLVTLAWGRRCRDEMVSACIEVRVRIAEGACQARDERVPLMRGSALLPDVTLHLRLIAAAAVGGCYPPRLDLFLPEQEFMLF